MKEPFDNSEELIYGEYSKIGSPKKVEIPDDKILAQATVRFSDKGELTELRTSNHGEFVPLPFRESPITNFKKSIEHDFVDHVIFAPEMYANGFENHGTVSNEEEVLVDLSILLRDSNKRNGGLASASIKDAINLKKFEIEYAELLKKNKTAQNISEQDRNEVSNLKSLIKYLREAIDKRTLYIKDGKLSGMDAIHTKLKSAEEFIAKMSPAIKDGLNLTIENTIIEKTDLPAQTVATLRRING